MSYKTLCFIVVFKTILIGIFMVHLEGLQVFLLRTTAYFLSLEVTQGN